MKLEKFQEKNKKCKGMFIGICSMVILLTIVIVIQCFAIYKEKKEFDAINGQIPEQNYDVMFAYTLEDKDGNKTNIDTIPEDKNYEVTVNCDNGASGEWNYESWGPLIKNLTTIRTKCKINFEPSKPTLIDTIKNTLVVTSGDGLYEVSHSDADFTYTSDEIAINNLKQSEYRFAGKNPNNYVNFNNELWRIIGLVNTPEGQRVKLIRNESIGNYSWDTSESSINNGYGVNEWSTSKLMELLNNGAYYNRSSGICYNGLNNATVNCDFGDSGLTNDAKNIIDTITWNLGSNDGTTYTNININTSNFYNLERSNHTGKICSSGTYCNDSVLRTTTWNGSVGLMYPSDYGYATSGGPTTDRATCLNTVLYSWRNISDCYSNDWLYNSSSVQWLLAPYADRTYASYVFLLGTTGYVNSNRYTNDAYAILPAIYLKTSVKTESGSGSFDSPYHLKA